MWKIIFIVTYLLFFLNSNVHNFLASIIEVSHRYCLDLAPTNSRYKFLYQAMACGEPPSPNIFISDLKSLGIYHLLVVSGSHFVFLEYLLLPLSRRFNYCGKIFSFILLTWFALTCLLAPPVLRALINFMLRKLNVEIKANWQGHHLALLSGLITLTIYPEWLISLSFILSWTASLLITLPIRHSLQKHMTVFLGLIPLIFTMQPMTPLVGLCNWILTPVLGLIMLPACLLSMAITPLSTLVDHLWSATEKVFRLLASELSHTQSDTAYSTQSAQLSYGHVNGTFFIFWFYIILLHVCIHFIEREKARHETSFLH